MAYDSRIFRILIASPSDVGEEREIAVSVIQEWNDLYSYSRKVTLLPLRWETHTAPQYGTRPQEAINRAIVDDCDMLVGIFWTRIGTPTNTADSGTLEEIERVGRAKKPVMLYFSKIRADLGKIEVAQIEQLRQFKSKTYPQGLIESYKSRVEFRRKFARQLELQIRDLQRNEASGRSPLSLTFLSLETSQSVGEKRNGLVELPRVTDFSDVPPDQRAAVEELLARYNRASTYMPIPLVLANTSSSGLRNLYVELGISSSSPDAEVTDFITSASDNALWRASSDEEWFDIIAGVERVPTMLDQVNSQVAQFEINELQKVGNDWRLAFQWEALQSQRTRIITPVFFVKAPRSAEFMLTAKIFSDSFPEPFVLHAAMSLEVREVNATLDQLLPNWPALLAGEKAVGQGRVCET